MMTTNHVAPLAPLFAGLAALALVGCGDDTIGDCLSAEQPGVVTISEMSIDIDAAEHGLHPDADCPLDVTVVGISGHFTPDDPGDEVSPLANDPWPWADELPKASRACLESLGVSSGQVTPAVLVASHPHSPCAPSVWLSLPELESALQGCEHTCP